VEPTKEQWYQGRIAELEAQVRQRDHAVSEDPGTQSGPSLSRRVPFGDVVGFDATLFFGIARAITVGIARNPERSTHIQLDPVTRSIIVRGDRKSGAKKSFTDSAARYSEAPVWISYH